MKINVETQGFTLTPAISAWLHEQIGSSLDRFDGDIRSIDVYVKNVSGPQGGDGKAAAVSVYLKHRMPVCITTVHQDLYTAVSITAQRCQRAVRKSLGKRRRLQRSLLRRLNLANANVSPY